MRLNYVVYASIMGSCSKNSECIGSFNEYDRAYERTEYLLTKTEFAPLGEVMIHDSERNVMYFFTKENGKVVAV